MTDNEIIKALECCNGWDGRCSNCPLKKEGTNCKEKLSAYALDLINRQKAEIERLKGSVITNNVVEISKIRKTAKCEAIDELAERLKNKCHNYYPSVDTYCLSRSCVEVKDIKIIAKEMLEEKR